MKTHSFSALPYSLISLMNHASFVSPKDFTLVIFSVSSTFILLLGFSS